MEPITKKNKTIPLIEEPTQILRRTTKKWETKLADLKLTCK
jgi:hypothetical protein